MITLVGTGGAGKSTLGALLAKRLQVAFFDLDQQFKMSYGDISKYIDSHGYDSYARSNVETFCALFLGANRLGVIALSSGFITYPRDVHPEYWDVRREVELSLETFVLLPSLDRDICVPEIVRRQLTRPFARTQSREEAVIRARFPVHMALAAPKIETMRPHTIVIDEIIAMLERGRQLS
jgi:shikimate kinase